MNEVAKILEMLLELESKYDFSDNHQDMEEIFIIESMIADAEFLLHVLKEVDNK